MAINGTAAYYTYVTLQAPGGTNADATAIAAAFNGVVYPAVSNTAATASAATATVTISWPEAGIKMAKELVRDFVVSEIVDMKATLNAAVTNITSTTQITVS